MKRLFYQSIYFTKNITKLPFKLNTLSDKNVKHILQYIG